MSVRSAHLFIRVIRSSILVLGGERAIEGKEGLAVRGGVMSYLNYI